jgi:dihydrofolate reductase
MRPQVSVFIAASLDGFIARADGAIDWLGAVEREGEDYGFAAFFASVDALVMGRKTYETALGFEPWPYAGLRCVVMTGDTARASRHGEEFAAGDLSALLERLGAEGVKRVYVDGGTVIAQALKARLVDDMTVSVIPVLLGEGTPLAPGVGGGAGAGAVGAAGGDVRLELVEHRAYASGLVQLRYRLAR